MNRRWEAGYLMLIAAGITLLAGILFPWARVDSAGRDFYAMQLRLYTPLVTTIVLGLALIAAGFTRNLWAALVGLVAAFGATLVVLMIHTDVYTGLAAAAPLLAVADAAHVTGMGIDIIWAAGLLAGVGGFITFLQAAPKVVT